MKLLVAPSILAADFGNLERQIEMLNNSTADWIHVDVMDGLFVPNISLGFPIVRAIKKYSRKPLNLHLMIVEPERYLRRFKDAGADHLIVHYEACMHLDRTIHAIKELECLAGVALNPHTPVAVLLDIVADIDMVLIMSVNPGFGGQSFIPEALNKLRAVRQKLDAYQEKTGRKILLEIDGGVKADNIAEIAKAGADTFVAGSAVFGKPDADGGYRGTVGALRQALASLS